ncbi:SHOCT domain-containing protein [Rhodococcus sp. BE178]|uniref:SHOCT domain-containing protein n=1 Tax=Rhodococcus sp. BE178 TaxID=2817737 RepID=UPI003D250B2C
MMFWYGNGMNGWGYALMALVMIAILVVIVLMVIVVARALTSTAQPPPSPPPSDTPEQLLAQRMARGEIDEDEYQRKLGLLRDRHSPGQEGR